MRTLVIGDVHGCAAELATLLDAVPADRVVLVGDLYTKGPDPAGVWRLIRERGLEAVLGNHDARLLQVLDGERPDDDEARACVAALDDEDPAWRDHLRGLPIFLDDVAGSTVVHAGLHPSGSLAATPRGMAISVRTLPGETGPTWWVDAYRGDRAVLYGHDARRGLVVRTREGVPHLIGLDTGCVYGGVLSGWIVEMRRLVQVPAKARYRAVGSAAVGA